MSSPLAVLRATAAGLCLLALGACGRGGQPPAPPPPAVAVMTIGSSPVPNVIDLPGRIAAIRTSEVRARTDGIVERRLYQEGTDVRADQPLFQIDPRDKRAALQQAQAALQRAEAARTNAQQVVGRYSPLVSARAVSAQEYDSAITQLRQAEAGVADAKAAVARAQLELDYATVRAPIAGRAGRALVTEGALVSAAGATLMTTIDQLNPIYAVFTQSSSDMMNLMRQVRSGQLKLPSLDNAEVRLVLEDGSEYGPIGRLDFTDQSVDPTTGSQVLRATFTNVNRTLLPGQFVRGRIYAGTIVAGIKVPQRAVQISNEEAMVFVVGRDDVVAPRPVELGSLVGGDWIIRSGLKPGDRLIVDGWMKARPGQKVRPTAGGAGAPGPAGAAGRTAPPPAR